MAGIRGEARNGPIQQLSVLSAVVSIRGFVGFLRKRREPGTPGQVQAGMGNGTLSRWTDASGWRERERQTPRTTTVDTSTENRENKTS